MAKLPLPANDVDAPDEDTLTMFLTLIDSLREGDEVTLYWNGEEAAHFADGRVSVLNAEGYQNFVADYQALRVTWANQERFEGEQFLPDWTELVEHYSLPAGVPQDLLARAAPRPAPGGA